MRICFLVSKFLNISIKVYSDIQNNKNIHYFRILIYLYVITSKLYSCKQFRF
jgi:hypothetical protein